MRAGARSDLAETRRGPPRLRCSCERAAARSMAVAARRRRTGQLIPRECLTPAPIDVVRPMMRDLTHPTEPLSDRQREVATAVEPRGLRTYTPSLAVLARSAGVYHWTPEGRRLYDFTS